MLYLTVYDDDDNNNNNNTFNGKYWAIFGTKLSGPPWIWISEGPGIYNFWAKRNLLLSITKYFPATKIQS